MRILPALIFALVAILPAAAQDDSVIVGGFGSSGRTLIDPATGEPRYVPDLLPPWQDEVIKLKPPGQHRAKKPAAVASDTPASEPDAVAEPPIRHHTKKPTTVASDTPASEPAPVAERPKKKRVATVAPAESPKPATQPSSGISGFADIDLITGAGSQRPAPTKPAPVKQAAAPKPVAPKPAPVVETPKPVKTASIEPPRAKAPAGNRRDSISFTAGASDPSGAAVSAVRALAGSLASAIGDNGRVQLMAYAGGRGEKTSDTRRLSLKRALVIRQLLIDDGIPSERIDVFALGGADDSGPLDRVDVFVKG